MAGLISSGRLLKSTRALIAEAPSALALSLDYETAKRPLPEELRLHGGLHRENI